MARINIEESLWSNPRFLDLCIRVGDAAKAVGALVLAWRKAQECFKQKRLIGRDEWDRLACAREMLETGLAEPTDDGVYLKGQTEAFAYLRVRQELGRKGGSSKPKQTQANRSKRKQTEASSSSSSSASVSSSESESTSGSNTNTFALESDDSAPRISPTTPVWEAYASAMNKRHGEAPKRDRTVNALLATLARNLGSEAPPVAAFYVSHNDQFYVRARHPLNLLVRDYQKLRIEWKTGNKMTSLEAKSAETADHYRDQLRRIAEGSL